MVQSYYNLDQAAEILGKSTDELNQMVRRGDIRAFADGGSWKFRTQDIDELKRTNELVSEYDFSADDDASIDDLLKTPVRKPSDSSVGQELQSDPASAGSGESDVRLIFSDTNDGSDSDIILVPHGDDEPADLPPKASDTPTIMDKPPGDSDIRLASSEPSVSEDPVELPSEKKAEISGLIPLRPEDELLLDDSDDDLVLEDHPAPAHAGQTPTKEDSNLDFLLDDELGTGFNIDGSEDDLDLADLNLADKTPTVKQSAGDDDDDSGSDFDLNLDDIGLAQDITPTSGDSGININRPDDSGILLNKAADSGISLRSDETDTSDSEFNVSLDSDDDIFGSDEMPGFKASDTSPRVARVEEEDSDEISDSDFELAIDEDVELEGESGSEVVALDDDEDSSDDFDEEFDEEEAAYGSVVAEPMMVEAAAAPWGGPWVFLLSLTSVVFVVVMMMMYEITRNAWSYNAPYSLNATIIQYVYDIGKSAGLMP